MGIVRIVMCVCGRNDNNDVIGCKNGHLRLIDLCIAIRVREKGKGKKKGLKKRSQRKVFGKIPPALWFTVGCYVA